MRALRREVRRRGPPRLGRARLSARLQLLPDGRALPHAEGREGARRLSHGACECFHRHREADRRRDRDRRSAVRGRQPAGLFRARAEREIEAHAVRGLLRRARRHQGDPVRARRAGPHQARHLGAGHGRPGHRRGDPLPRPLPAPRLRGRRQRVHRLPGEARRRRSEEDRRRRDQPRRLLRAALRLDGAALRRVHRVGRDLGLLRDLEEAHRREVQDLAVGARAITSCGSSASTRSKRR